MSALHLAILSIYFLLAILNSFVALYVWRGRSAFGAKAFAVYALVVALWAGGHGVELYVAGLSQKLFWARLQFATSLLLPPAWLIFTLNYTQHTNKVLRSTKVSLVIFPAGMLALGLTEPWHNLIWGQATLQIVAGIPLLQTSLGIAMWINIIYVLATFLLGILLLAQGLMDSLKIQRPPNIGILMALILPWVLGPLLAVNTGLPSSLSVFPLSFTLSVAILGHTIFRRHKNDLMSVARYALVEALDDAVLVIDPQDRVIDLNPKAAREFGYAYEKAVGQPIDEVLGLYPQLVAEVNLQSSNPDMAHASDVEVSRANELRTFNVRVTPLNKQDTGKAREEDPSSLAKLVILYDISQRKEIEAAERKQRQLAEGHAEVLARRDRYLTLLNSLSQIALQEADPEKLLQLLADQLISLSGADICYVTKWDEVRQAPIPVVASGVAMDTYRAIRTDPDGYTLTELVLDSGDALAIDNVVESILADSQFVEQLPANSLLVLPLIAEKQNYGAVILAFKQQHKFTLDEIAYCRQATAQVALSVSRALHAQSEIQAQLRADTLSEAIHALARSLELDEVLQNLLDFLSRLVPYETAIIMLMDVNNKLEVRATKGYENEDETSELVGTRFPLSAFPQLQLLATTQEAILVHDTKFHSGWANYAGMENVRGWIGVPLVVSNSTLGIFSAHTSMPGGFQEEHLRTGKALAAQAAFAVQNAQLFTQVQRLALTDPLTGINNRRHFFELALAEFERARRYGRPLSALMLDLDNFKDNNDKYGHLVGDEILREVAARCAQNLREADILGRYGGEEFVCLLPETDVEDARNVAERVRRRVADVPIITRAGSIPVTVSIGASELNRSNNDVLSLIEQADAALYESKQGGRNQVVVK